MKPRWVLDLLSFSAFFCVAHSSFVFPPVIVPRAAPYLPGSCIVVIQRAPLG